MNSPSSAAGSANAYRRYAGVTGTTEHPGDRAVDAERHGTDGRDANERRGSGSVCRVGDEHGRDGVGEHGGREPEREIGDEREADDVPAVAPGLALLAGTE